MKFIFFLILPFIGYCQNQKLLIEDLITEDFEQAKSIYSPKAYCFVNFVYDSTNGEKRPQLQYFDSIDVTSFCDISYNFQYWEVQKINVFLARPKLPYCAFIDGDTLTYYVLRNKVNDNLYKLFGFITTDILKITCPNCKEFQLTLKKLISTKLINKKELKYYYKSIIKSNFISPKANKPSVILAKFLGNKKGFNSTIIIGQEYLSDCFLGFYPINRSQK